MYMNNRLKCLLTYLKQKAENKSPISLTKIVILVIYCFKKILWEEYYKSLINNE